MPSESAIMAQPRLPSRNCNEAREQGRERYVHPGLATQQVLGLMANTRVNIDFGFRLTVSASSGQIFQMNNAQEAPTNSSHWHQFGVWIPFLGFACRLILLSGVSCIMMLNSLRRFWMGHGPDHGKIGLALSSVMFLAVAIMWFGVVRQLKRPVKK
jgi:hypothetical protein